MTNRTTKPCGQCGKTMRGVSPQRKYCTECMRDRAKARKNQPDKKRKEHAGKTGCRQSIVGIERPLSIEEIVMSAESEGLSYGQYVLKYGL